MINIKITNMLKITKGDFQLEPGKITGITGLNATGKTSVATLTAALLTGSDNPAGGKSKAKIYLQDDAESGNAEATCNNQPISRWDAVSGQLGMFAIGEKDFKRPSEASVGLVDFCGQMTQPQKIALWEGYFLPDDEVLFEHIEKQLAPHLNEETLKGVMDVAGGQSVDIALSTYQARARDEKSYWTKITGENWGKAKGADWLPDGWSAELDGVSIKQMDDRIGHLQNELRSLHVEQAISRSDIERGKEAQMELAENNVKLDEMRTEVRRMMKDLEEPEAQLAELKKLWDICHSKTTNLQRTKPHDQSSHIMNCPECGSKLLLSDFGRQLETFNEDSFLKLRQEWEQGFEEASEKERLAKEAFDELDGKMGELREAKDDLVSKGKLLSAKCEGLKQLAKFADATPTESNDKEIERVEEEIQRAKALRQLIDKRLSARAHHENVIQYTMIANIMGPKGVRATCMEENMTKFDTLLSTISNATGWPRVEVDKSYAISIGDRSFLRLCAESDRLRAQYTIQIALARFDRDPVIILDCVDHLDDANQFALANLIKAVCGREDPPAIMICGTELDVHQLNKDGNNYRIVNGKTTLIR